MAEQQVASPSTTQDMHGGGLLRALTMLLLVLGFFFVSGACGLLYQVVWTRKLVLLFGTTSYAVSTVLSIFFLGLGVGSWWGGRLADRTERPLRLYGIFEIIIGLWAIFFIVTVTWGEAYPVAVLKALELDRFTGIVLRGLLALTILIVPVTLMGATLPLLAKFVGSTNNFRGLRIGALYTLNTLGAVCGCFITGFYLIQIYGYTTTTLMGAGANVLVGVLALLLGRTSVQAAQPKTQTAAASTEATHEGSMYFYLPLFAFTLSGFAALSMEVIWTRLLTIVFLGTTYAYTTMLTTMLLGIVLGSAVASALADRIKHPTSKLGGVLMLTGVAGLFVLIYIAGMPEKIMGLRGDWETVIQGKFTLAFIALFPATFFFGMTFPLVVKAASGVSARLGRDIGTLYAANTLGGVLGAIAGGYFFLPMLGSHWGLIALSSLLIAGGGIVCWGVRPERFYWKAGFSLITICSLYFAWQRVPEDVSQSLNLGYINPEHQEVIHYKEGVEGTVAVSQPLKGEEGADRVLWINRVQATTSIEKGVKMNRLQGVLPLVFDRDVRDVLFMCFGSGITCGTLALSEFNQIDAVEISPDVLEAAHFFSNDNLGVIKNPKVKFHIDDGRNYLLTTDKKYDFITFEPMPLAMAGVSTFYTRDYYELCRDHLKPKGMVSQWVPMHSLNPDVVRSLVYTFTQVFPEYSCWFVNADLFLIGSKEPLKIDPAGLLKNMENPTLKNALDKVGLGDPTEIISCFILDKPGLDAYAAGGKIMSDDLPWAEFEAPKLVGNRQVPDTIAQLVPHVTSPMVLIDAGSLSSTWRDAIALRARSRKQDLIAVQDYYTAMPGNHKSLDGFIVSLEIDPNNLNAQYYARQDAMRHSKLMIQWAEYDKAVALLERVMPLLPADATLSELYKRAKARLAAETE